MRAHGKWTPLEPAMKPTKAAIATRPCLCARRGEETAQVRHGIAYSRVEEVLGGMSTPRVGQHSGVVLRAWREDALDLGVAEKADGLGGVIAHPARGPFLRQPERVPARVEHGRSTGMTGCGAGDACCVLPSGYPSGLRTRT